MSKFLYYPKKYDTFNVIADSNGKCIEVVAINGDECHKCKLNKFDEFCYNTACKSEEREDNENIMFIPVEV